MPPYEKLSPEVIEQMRTLRMQGGTYRSIGDRLGVNPTTVRKYTRDIDTRWGKSDG